MWDLSDGPDNAYNITVNPKNQKDAVFGDCGRDGSDIDYE